MQSICRLSPHTSILFLCDIQVKFAPLIHHFPTVVSRSSLLLQASNVMSIPKIVSEQYPQALGATVEELTSFLPTSKPDEYYIYPKKKFSMLVPECISKLKEFNRKQVMLCGIEAHVCISQTAFDLLEHGYEVHIICDAVSSQRPHDRAVALSRLRSAGAILTTSEAVLFDLVRSADDVHFKAISGLIKKFNAEGTNKFASDSNI